MAAILSRGIWVKPICAGLFGLDMNTNLQFYPQSSLRLKGITQPMRDDVTWRCLSLAGRRYKMIPVWVPSLTFFHYLLDLELSAIYWLKDVQHQFCSMKGILDYSSTRKWHWLLANSAGPLVQGRQLRRRAGNFLLIFLQFYVYDLRFKTWGPTTFLTEFQTLTGCWNPLSRSPETLLKY